MADIDEPFGVPTKHKAPVPAFDPLLDAARGVAQSVAWLRREVNRAMMMVENMHGVAKEMLDSKLAPDATKHVEAQVGILHTQIDRLNDFCLRLEGLSAELSTVGIMEEKIKLPSSYKAKQDSKTVTEE